MAPTRLSAKYKQDPADKLDYGWDWQGGDQPFLLPEETISSSTWTCYDTSWVASSDVVLSSPAHDTTTTSFWAKAASLSISGPYFFTNHIVSSEGREKDESIQITFEEQ